VPLGGAQTGAEPSAILPQRRFFAVVHSAGAVSHDLPARPAYGDGSPV